MEEDLFTYELGVVEDFHFPCIVRPSDNLKNGDLDVYEPRQCYDEYERMFTEDVILIGDRLVKLMNISLEQWLDLKYEDHKKVDKEIVEGIVGTWLIRSYKKQFEEYMEIKSQLEVCGINTMVECDPTNIDFAEWLASKFSNHRIMHWYTKNALWLYWKRGDDEEVLTEYKLSDLEEENMSDENEIAEICRIETDIFLFETPLCKAFKEMTNDDAIQMEQEWFDKREPMEDDDDINDLDEYLIPCDAPYYVNEEEERFKEIMSKLIKIPYKKPPTFKSENFEVIKYSLGPAEEYVTIKEHEYDIWLRTKENVS
ncbi:hypothetical protein Tco_0866727 [Tanacetum coccineum]